MHQYRDELMTTKLRLAKITDIPAMHRIRLAVKENPLLSHAITEESYLPYLGEIGCTWVIEQWPENISRAEAMHPHISTIAGFASGNHKNGNIWALFIDPGHEGKGYGRSLHDTMIAYLFAQGLAELNLSTGIGTRAQRFYERAGWLKTQEEKDEAFYVLKPLRKN